MHTAIELEQQVVAAFGSAIDGLHVDVEARDLALDRIKSIIRTGSDTVFARVLGHMVAIDRLRLDRELAMSERQTSSIRLSAPASLQDVHALLEAMRNPSAASDATSDKLASLPPADAQPGGGGPPQSQ